MCLRVYAGKVEEKNMKKYNFFASFKSLKGVGSISQRYGSDPDPHQKVTNLQHCFSHSLINSGDGDPAGAVGL
jgi:hypothetical protein